MITIYKLSHPPPLLYPTFEKAGIGSNNILKPVSCAGYQQINKNLTSCKKRVSVCSDIKKEMLWKF